MAKSITLFTGDEASVLPLEDDAREIRKRCRAPHEWQEQLVQSLCLSGWTYSMLAWLTTPDALFWIELLTAERDRKRIDFDPSFEVENFASEQAVQSCGDDREKWLLLALQVLTQRGWTRMMLSDAFSIPRSTIIRKLEKVALEKHLDDPGLIADLRRDSQAV